MAVVIEGSVVVRGGRQRPLRPALVLGLATGALVLAACSGSGDGDTPGATPSPRASVEPSAPPSTPALRVRAGDPARQTGSAPVELEVVTAQGGRVRIVEGPDGQRAFDFPRYVATGAYPRAVLTVTSTGDEDALDPGDDAFVWGAEFRLDPRNEGRANDNGNNLLQRGLRTDPTSFKAELDHSRPGCTVRGTDGILSVRLSEPVAYGVWYRIRCERDGDRLTVRSFKVDEPDEVLAKSRRGPIGTMEMSGLPLSVGGKIAPDGEIVDGGTDQFNGSVADPFVDIDSDE